MIILLLSSLLIKGTEDAHAVICSNSCTFELKEAETSNSLLLMPSLTSATIVEETNTRTLKKQEVQTSLIQAIDLVVNNVNVSPSL